MAPSSRTFRALCVVALAVVAGLPAVASSSLPRPPLEFTVSPDTVALHAPITIRVAPKSAEAWPSHLRLDVYVMWATTERAAFLGPDGVWSPTPVPFRPSMDRASAPIVLEWRPLRQHPHIPLAMLAVPAGVDPLRRSTWRYQPVLRSTRVAVESPVRPYDLATAVSLIAATGLAILAVALLPWSPGGLSERARGASVDPRQAVPPPTST